jgi:hypothetical protein
MNNAQRSLVDLYRVETDPVAWQAKKDDAKASVAKARKSGFFKLGKAVWLQPAGGESKSASSATRRRFLLRGFEIEAVVKSRHGNVVPDVRGTDDLELAVAYLVSYAGSGFEPTGFAARFMPWLDIKSKEMASARRVFARTQPTAKSPFFFSADDVARHLGVSLAERDALGLRTIGACDVDREERLQIAKARKRQKDRDRQRASRKSSKSREEYVANSVHASKPWIAAGVSRATWYRKNPVRQVVAITLIENSIGDVPVSTESSGQSLASQQSDETQNATVKNRDERKRNLGLGTSPQRVPRRAEPCVIARAAS